MSKLWYDEYEWCGDVVKLWRLKFEDSTTQLNFDTLDQALAFRADIVNGY